MAAVALETDRLRLRPWKIGDLEDYARIFAKPGAMAFQMDRGLTRAEAEQFLRFHIEAWTRHPFGAWAIRTKATGRPIGWVSLETTDSFPQAPRGVQIGWRLDPGEWGHGYATEAARAVLTYGFEVLRLPEIYVLFHRDNTPSARVAAKLGATAHSTITDESGAHLREVHVLRPLSAGSRGYDPGMDALKPLVLAVDVRAAERRDSMDFYPPDDVSRPVPAVLVIHGGPIPAEVRPTPRDWPQYQAYGSLIAGRGVLAATVDHRLHSPAAYPIADEDVRAAVEALRADPRVDGDRVALWFFSGGGLLSDGWLREPPAWLRCLALTYPLLEPLEGWGVDERFRPVEAVTHSGDLPIVLTRVGRERPDVTEGVHRFVDAAAKTRLEIIDVPDGRHGFDTLDDDDVSRAAITHAVDAVLATLR